MTIKTDVNMTTWLREKMSACETEIEYLEELLCTTSGPQPQLLKDLELEKRRLSEYTNEWERYVALAVYKD